MPTAERPDRDANQEDAGARSVALRVVFDRPPDHGQLTAAVAFRDQLHELMTAKDPVDGSTAWGWHACRVLAVELIPADDLADDSTGWQVNSDGLTWQQVDHVDHWAGEHAAVSCTPLPGSEPGWGRARRQLVDAYAAAPDEDGNGGTLAPGWPRVLLPDGVHYPATADAVALARGAA